MSIRALRPLAVLALALVPGLAVAAECDGGVFVATGDVSGDAAAAGKLLSGLGLALVGIDPDEIDYDSSMEGIDPDEIDYDSAACLQGGTDASGAALPGTTIHVEGVPLTGIDPDEIDVAWAKKVLAATAPAQTREHVLLARQVGVPSAAAETARGYAVVRLDGIEVRAEVVSTRPYVTRAVADLTLTVQELVSTDRGLEPLELWIDGETALDAAR